MNNRSDEVILIGTMPSLFNGTNALDIRKFIVNGDGRFASGSVNVGVRSDDEYHSDIARRVGFRPVGGGRLVRITADADRSRLVRDIADCWGLDLAVSFTQGSAPTSAELLLFSSSGSYGREESEMILTRAPAICTAYDVGSFTRV